MTTSQPAATTRTTPRPPRLAAWSIRHPGAALALWVAIVLAAVAAGGLVGTRTASQDSDASGDSLRAERVLATAGFPERHAQEQTLITRRDGRRLDDTDIAAAAAALRAELGPVPNVIDLADPVRSDDVTAALVAWRIAGPRDTADERVAPMIAATARAAAAVPQLSLAQVGDASLERALVAALGRDLRTAEVLSIPITIVLLLIVFGAVVAAALPMLLALSAIVGAFGLAAVVSLLVPSNDTVASVLLVVGIAVGVDYALFVVRRARDERRAGATVLDSVRIACATSGRAVVVSGLTVIVAMAGMLLAGDATFTALGVACMIVVAVAVLGSLIALPAALVLLGDRVDRLRVPLIAARRARAHGQSRFWGAVATRATRRPALTLLVVGGLLVAVALPLTQMRMQLPGTDDLPRSIPEMRTLDRLEAAFPTEGGAHTVVVRASRTVDAPDVRAALVRLEAELRASGHVAPGWDPTPQVAPDRRVLSLDVPYTGASTGVHATAALDLLRERILPEVVRPVAEAHVTGDAAGSRDFALLVRERLPLVIAFVISLTFLVMLWSFRNAWVALATVVLNGLSVAAAYGLLVIVFQHHWLDGLLGITTNGTIVAWLPLFLFVILFGLSMDYHVFVLSRIREARLAGEDPASAIVTGVRRTASVVTSAAVIMIAAFSVFALLSTIDMKQLGVGLSVAVAIDATLVRGVLLPAALRLLGDRAWEESRLLRRSGRTASAGRAPAATLTRPE